MAYPTFSSKKWDNKLTDNRKPPRFGGMEVQLTPDQQALISDVIASGRLHRPEEAMQRRFCRGRNVSAGAWNTGRC